MKIRKAASQTFLYTLRFDKILICAVWYILKTFQIMLLYVQALAC
jgi:hypothetical protein